MHFFVMRLGGTVWAEPDRLVQIEDDLEDVIHIDAEGVECNWSGGFCFREETGQEMRRSVSK